MTSVLAVPRTAPGAGRVTAVAVGLVVAELVYGVCALDLALRLVFGANLGLRTSLLLLGVPPYALLAVAVALVGRSPGRRALATAVALAAGALAVVTALAWTRPDAFLGGLHGLLAPMLAPLAWGIARRRGHRLWLLGLLAAPLVGHLALVLTVPHLGFPFQLDLNTRVLLGVAGLVGPVAAATACWAIDEWDLSRRSPTG